MAAWVVEEYVPKTALDSGAVKIELRKSRLQILNIWHDARERLTESRSRVTIKRGSKGSIVMLFRSERYPRHELSKRSIVETPTVP